MKPLEHWLSVDLSSHKGTLAIHRTMSDKEPVLLSSQIVTEKGNHSESFILQLNQALETIDLDLGSIDRLITCSGPGSFTGLRIALASLKALAYPRQLPIEIISGSEARGHAWIKRNPSCCSDEIHVITHITADKFVSGKFVRPTEGEYSFVEETNHTDWSFLSSSTKATVLLSDNKIISDLPKLPFLSVDFQSLNAEMLGASLRQCKTRKTHQSIMDWVNASPQYFGSTRF